MSITEITEKMQGMSDAEKEKYIRKKRVLLLDEIHEMQQKLDQLDYLLFCLKKGIHF